VPALIAGAIGGHRVGAETKARAPDITQHGGGGP